MTQEALKLALKMHRKNESHRTLAETRYWCEQYKLLAQQAIEALAQPEQEPVKCNLCDDSGIGSFGVHSMCICQYAKATPSQRTEQKMVMWPCLIDTADFSKGTVTVVMQCEDYKVSAGTHWLSTTPPKENT